MRLTAAWDCRQIWAFLAASEMRAPVVLLNHPFRSLSLFPLPLFFLLTTIEYTGTDTVKQPRGADKLPALCARTWAETQEG